MKYNKTNTVKVFVKNNFFAVKFSGFTVCCPHLLLSKEVGEASFAGLFISHFIEVFI